MRQSSEADIDLAARYIREGKLVAFPTETVYGLGADALNPLAVAKIFEAKERPNFDPLIVHIADKADVYRLTTTCDERITMLMDAFWPGPLTIVLPKTKIVPDIVTSGLSTVGIRMPLHETALELIKKAGCPIAAPSANKFGRISPTTASHVKKQLPLVDFVLDGGPTSVGIESTIIIITDIGFQIVRNGIITRDEIEKYIPYDEITVAKEMVAPGMLKSHYSPTKPFTLISEDTIAQHFIENDAGLISFTKKCEYKFKKVIRVSEHLDLKDYAVNMFAAMHEMEDSDVEHIYAETVPSTGVGIAIMDRLHKAAYTSGRKS